MKLIDKRAAYEALKKEAEMHELPFTREAYERAARIIDKMYAYTLDVKERHGEWLKVHEDFGIGYKCSACGDYAFRVYSYNYYGYRMPRYCPHCGARMGGDKHAVD